MIINNNSKLLKNIFKITGAMTPTIIHRTQTNLPKHVKASFQQGRKPPNFYRNFTTSNKQDQAETAKKLIVTLAVAYFYWCLGVYYLSLQEDEFALPPDTELLSDDYKGDSSDSNKYT